LCKSLLDGYADEREVIMDEHNTPEVDPHLVQTDNALDEHALRRENSDDPEELKRNTEELEGVIDNTFLDEHKWEP
jgi:hypothetical protein